MNRLYDAARQRYLEAAQDWRLATWDVYLLDQTYVFDPEHTLFSVDVDPLSVLAKSIQPLLFLTTDKGAAGSTGAVFLPLWQQPPGEDEEDRLATSVVIVNRDTDALEWFGDVGFGLPFPPQGEEVVVSPDRTTGGFFVL